MLRTRKANFIQMSKSVLEEVTAPTTAELERQLDRPNMSATPTVGEVVRAWRIKRDLSQLALSNLVGHKTGEWIGMIENNVRALDLEKIPGMAAALRIDPRDLLKVAMFEYYPGVAQVLYPGDTPGAPSEKEPAPVTVSPEALQLAQRIENLSPEARDIVAGVVSMAGSGQGRLRPGTKIHINRSRL